jgi:predicted nucleic acid-binding protein
VTRYLLDTNIISNVIKPSPSPSLLAWLETRADTELYISSLTIAEIKRGILEKPDGRKRAALEQWFSGAEGPQALFAGRVLPFDESAALLWASLVVDGKNAGRPRNPLDMIVASIALTNDCMLVTDNERDFHGLDFINPLREGFDE